MREFLLFLRNVSKIACTNIFLLKPQENIQKQHQIYTSLQKFIVSNYIIYYIFNAAARIDQLYSGRVFQAPSTF